MGDFSQIPLRTGSARGERDSWWIANKEHAAREDRGLASFPCPYLKGAVELTEERERHIAENHPDLLPEHREFIASTLADPDLVRSGKRFGSAKSFSRWYADLKGGKHIVVVVVSAPTTGRHWIVTAYIARRLAEGAVEWKRS